MTAFCSSVMLVSSVFSASECCGRGWQNSVSDQAGRGCSFFSAWIKAVALGVFGQADMVQRFDVDHFQVDPVGGGFFAVADEGVDFHIGYCGVEVVDAVADEEFHLGFAGAKVLRACIRYLKNGFDPSVVIVASKNVLAPGPGAAAYSAAKAGLTQLARVAALELGESGIRVNTVHPNAVYDTAIWTDEVLAKRAEHYGLSVEEYKSKNVLKKEVTSSDVATVITLLAANSFSCTTGAQIPVDAGNERVI